MRILLVGGGSGGHVTPLKAIVEELDSNKHKIFIVSDRGFFKQTQFLFRDYPDIKLSKIFAGKFRRYHSKSIVWHIIHISTFFKNIRDIFYIVIGLIQSLIFMILHKPDIVFCKGGFVCIPMGISARLFGKKIIIHDSDTRPGLTNRFLSKWAKTIATGMPTDFYPYQKDKMIYVGMPVDSSYNKITKLDKQKYKDELGFNKNQPVLLVTGGGNGSEQINSLIGQIADQLLAKGWGIEHICGKDKAKAILKIRGDDERNICWHISEFTDMLPRILAADIVITRTSATTLQECANSNKTVIGIPSPNLLDQAMNAEFFSSKDSLVYLKETGLEPARLLSEINKLAMNPAQAKNLADNLFTNFAKPDAAKQIANILVD